MEENEIVKKYLLKIKNNDICSEYNISRYTLMKILKKNNVTLKQERNSTINENYFEKIDTEEKAYWLGFLYADGYIRKRKSSELKLKLSTKDKNHIEAFKISIESNSNIIDGVDNKIKYSYIGIYSKKIVNDLISHGCINKKSLFIKFPAINNELERHFIRGYFDGDGSICFSDRQKILNFVSGSLTFIESIKEIFVKKLNIYDCKIIKNDNSYCISWSRIEDIKNIYDYFYKDSSIFLERKKIKFEEIIKKSKVNKLQKYKNYRLYIFSGEKNIIVIGNNLEEASNEIDRKIKELNISKKGILIEHNTNQLKTIVL